MNEDLLRFFESLGYKVTEDPNKWGYLFFDSEGNELDKNFGKVIYKYRVGCKGLDEKDCLSVKDNSNCFIGKNGEKIAISRHNCLGEIIFNNGLTIDTNGCDSFAVYYKGKKNSKTILIDITFGFDYSFIIRIYINDILVGYIKQKDTYYEINNCRKYVDYDICGLKDNFMEVINNFIYKICQQDEDIKKGYKLIESFLSNGIYDALMDWSNKLDERLEGCEYIEKCIAKSLENAKEKVIEYQKELEQQDAEVLRLQRLINQRDEQKVKKMGALS